MTNTQYENITLDEIINDNLIDNNLINTFFTDYNIIKFTCKITICKKVKVPVLIIINKKKGSTTIVSKLNHNSDMIASIFDKYDYSYFPYEALDHRDDIIALEVTTRCHPDDEFNINIGLKCAKRKYLNVVHRYLCIQLDNMNKYFNKMLTDFKREVNRYEPKPIDKGE